MITEELRKQLHQGICQEILSLNEQGIPNNADKHSQLSVRLAKRLRDISDLLFDLVI